MKKGFTVNRAAYIASFCAALAVMVLFGEKYAYMIFYSLIILLLFSVLSLILSPLFIKINEYADKTDVFKNEPLSYGARISNKSFLPYPRITFLFHQGDFVRYEKISPRAVSVSSGESVIDGYTVSFPYRGKYDIGIERFYVSDILGLFRHGFLKKDVISITVFPEKIENFTLNLKSELLSKTASAFEMQQDVSADVSDIRKYTPSDDYRKIHWKMTAKKNEFIVKNYLSSVLNKTYIFLNTAKVPLEGEPKLRLEDKLVSYTAAAVNYCVMNRLPSLVSIGPGEADITAVSGFADYELLFRTFAEAEFNNEPYLPLALNEALKTDDFFNIAVFIFDITDDLFESFTNLSAMGHNVIVYYLCCEELKPDFVRQNFLSVLGESQVSVNMLYL